MTKDIKQLRKLLEKKYDLTLSDEELFDILEFYSEFIVDLVAEDYR